MKSLGGRCLKLGCSWLSFPGEREVEEKQDGCPRNSESWNNLEGWKRPGSKPLHGQGHFPHDSEKKQRFQEMEFLADPSRGGT